MATVDIPGPFEIRQRSLTLRDLDPNQTGTASARAPTDGLLAWWKLEDREGTVAADASGGGLTAQIQGDPRWVAADGPVKGALEFDGTKSYLECTESPDWPVTTSVSLALWYKAPVCDPADHRQQLLSGKGEVWQLQRRAQDGLLEFSLAGPITPTNSPAQGRPPRLLSTRNLDDGQWHHVTATYDGRRAVLYIDGDEESSTPASGLLASSTAPVTVGESSVSRGRFFKGALSDVRFYNRGLTPDEVRGLGKSGPKR